jgi:hypothetical protein
VNDDDADLINKNKVYEGKDAMFRLGGTLAPRGKCRRFRDKYDGIVSFFLYKSQSNCIIQHVKH